MAILIPSKNIFDFENKYKDNKITNVEYNNNKFINVVEEDGNVYTEVLYDYTNGPLPIITLPLDNSKIEGDYFYFKSNGELINDSGLRYVIGDCTISQFIMSCGYLDRNQITKHSFNVLKRQDIYNYITKVYGWDEKTLAKATITIDGQTTVGNVEYYVGEKTTNEQGEEVYTQTFIYKNVSQEQYSIPECLTKLSINRNNVTYIPNKTTQETYTIPNELSISIKSIPIIQTSIKTKTFTYKLGEGPTIDNTLQHNANYLKINKEDYDKYQLNLKDNLYFGGFIGAKCITVGNYYTFSTNQTHDYHIKDCKLYFYDDGSTRLKVVVENLKLTGTYTEFTPKTVTITIQGYKYKLLFQDIYKYFICDNKDVSMIENELLQDGDNFNKKTIIHQDDGTTATEIETIPLKTFLSDNIIKQYKNGKELLTILCDIDDYYDENGDKVIDKLNSENKPMTFNLHDIVIPYINKDTPFSVYSSGKAKAFEVVTLNFSYSGVVRQKLTLLEILETEINDG